MQYGAITPTHSKSEELKANLSEPGKTSSDLELGTLKWHWACFSEGLGQ